MSKAIRDLIRAAKKAAKWMEGATAPNEVVTELRDLQGAIKKAKEEQEARKPSGYLLVVELSDGRRRITATVETADKYLSRAGWASLGVEAEVTHSTEVPDLARARETLRTVLQEERWSGQGMTWTGLSKRDLIAAIRKVKTIVNNH